MDALLVFLETLSPQIFIMVFLGTLFGIIVGAIPGLNGAVGISLLLPLTFMVDPQSGLLLLGGIYMGGMYGGSITGILLNVPGDLVAAPTAMEGFPMTKQGRAKEALYYSVFSSMFGGFIGVLTLIFFTPPLAQFSLKFGPAEMFFISLCGLAVIGALAGNNIYKSLFAVLFGLFVSTIGVDSLVGAYRFTLGTPGLKNGISVIPVVLGFFCFTEMFLNIGRKPGELVKYRDQNIKKTTVIKKILKKKVTLLKSAAIGTLVGILPGVGGTVPVFLSYGEAKRTSKNRQLFGKGNPEGIIAGEAANNSLVGGALIPLLALGVPGSATSAIIGGALVVHGIILGPDIFIQRPEVAYTFIYGMMLTVVAMALIGTFGVKYFSYILKIKMEYIIPIVLVFALFGAYSLRNNIFDVLIAIVFGIIGALFKKLDIPLAPIIIGVVLGPLLEKNLIRSMSIAEAEQIPLLQYLLFSPLSIFLLIMVFVILFLFLRMRDTDVDTEA